MQLGMSAPCRFVFLTIAVGLIAVGCGGPASETPETPETSPPPVAESEPPPPATEATENPREAHIRNNIVAMAESAFPDDTGLEWMIHSFDHQGDLSFVEVEPKPATVGYPRFQFAVSFQDEAAPVVAATYALIDGEYKLFSSEAGFEEVLPKSITVADS